MNITDLLLLLVGFVGLVLGGNLLVQGAVSIAARLNISPIIIGITLVGFGTSAPELVVSIQAVLSNSSGIAIGNVMGSNIANILLILGISSLMTPINIHRNTLKRDGTVLIIATLLCLAVVLKGEASRIVGLVFIAILVIYLVGTILYERRSESIVESESDIRASAIEIRLLSTWLSWSMVVFGGLITVAAARISVNSAVSIASGLGVSEVIIGLTIVAIGTSLPELVTSVVAAYKGHNELAFGNIIGSSIFNILGILGITASLQTIKIPATLADFDIWIMLLATTLIITLAWLRGRIDRFEGFLMALGYAAYIASLVANQ